MIGLILLLLIFLLEMWYIVFSIVGYLLFGIGLGLYVILLIDIVVVSVLDDKLGVVLGVYKMVLLLGNVFGVVVFGMVYIVLVVNLNLNLGGFIGMMFNVLLVIVVFLVILLLVFKN